MLAELVLSQGCEGQSVLCLLASGGLWLPWLVDGGALISAFVFSGVALCMCLLYLDSPVYKASGHIGLGLTWGPHFNLITSVKVPSPNTSPY